MQPCLDKRGGFTTLSFSFSSLEPPVAIPTLVKQSPQGRAEGSQQCSLQNAEPAFT